MTSKLIGTFPLDTLQIYFNASLELQEELIKAGFSVPFKTPLPIIYSDRRGRGTVKKQYLINPTRYGKTPEDLGWKTEENKFFIPPENPEVNVILDSESKLHFTLIFPKGENNYHLEKASSRQQNPEKWSNWFMFYLNMVNAKNLVRKLLDELGSGLKTWSPRTPLEIAREIQQGGKEKTFLTLIKPVSYNFCLGDFEHVKEYLENESQTKDFNFESLKLKIQSDNIEGVFAKIGFSRIEGVEPQMMIKLSTLTRPILTISGVMGPVKGKPRGKLVHCKHKEKFNGIVFDGLTFLHTLCCLFHAFGIYTRRIPPFIDEDYKLRARLLDWFL